MIATQPQESFLVSEELIRQKLSSIFVDSIILDNHFSIVAVSQNVLGWLGFSAEEVKKKSINFLSGKFDLEKLLRQELSRGHCDERNVTMFSKAGDRIDLEVSGFYLGLVTDINDKIVLLTKRSSREPSSATAVSIGQAEVDTFIYSTAHDLRGPVATIKGLVNLIKLRENNDELDHLIQLIDSHANKLDERLFRLVYLSQYSHEAGRTTSTLDPAVLETRLRKIIEKNAFVDFLEFQYESPVESIHGVNEGIMIALVENLLLHLLSLPMKTMKSSILFRLENLRSSIRLICVADGFEPDSDAPQILDDSDFLYTDLLKFPKLIHFYAMQKLAERLGASIKLRSLAVEKQQLEIIVPF